MIEKLNIDVGKTRKTTERTRPRQRNHPDVEELEDDVTRVTKQWTNCCESVVDRSARSISDAVVSLVFIRTVTTQK